MYGPKSSSPNSSSAHESSRRHQPRGKQLQRRNESESGRSSTTSLSSASSHALSTATTIIGRVWSLVTGAFAALRNELACLDIQSATVGSRTGLSLILGIARILVSATTLSSTTPATSGYTGTPLALALALWLRFLLLLLLRATLLLLTMSKWVRLSTATRCSTAASGDGKPRL